MKVSILIPTFNREKFLEEALKCVTQQMYKDIQIIIYDDGSVDGTQNMIQCFSSYCNIPILYNRSDNNNGVAFARNRLLELCNTEYACWWDSDDLCNIYRIQKQMRQIQRGFDVVFTAFRSFGSGSKHKAIPNCVSIPKKQRTPYAFASMLFKADKNIKFNEAKKFGGEDCAWSVMMQKNIKTKHIPEILYFVRYHSKRIGVVKNRIRRQDKSKTYAEVERRLCS